MKPTHLMYLTDSNAAAAKAMQDSTKTTFWFCKVPHSLNLFPCTSCQCFCRLSYYVLNYSALLAAVAPHLLLLLNLQA